jgi:hypothetical protein
VQTHTPLYSARAPSRVPARTKKAFRGIAPEGLVLRHCRAFRALHPPWGHRARRRRGGRSTAVSWIGSHTRRPARRWPRRMASPSTSSANWRTVRSTRTSHINVGTRAPLVNGEVEGHGRSPRTRGPSAPRGAPP